ncbi:MAG: hypothetical protein HPY52_00055 [Firmicutes bacterium]|nr:hypothetical protein [Bacillota bacterium]
MDDKLKQEIASFRYGLISPIVSRQDLAPGETTALIRQAASRHYVIPGSVRISVGERTIQRYLSMYSCNARRSEELLNGLFRTEPIVPPVVP